jgi:hypothetical protein
VEAILSFFIGLLGNALSEIASTVDAEKKEKIKEILAKIREENFISLAANKTLKTISVNGNEADSLKILISNDLLIKRIAQLITEDIKQDKFVDSIVREIKRFGNFDSQKSYPFEPLIEAFAVQFYSQVLANPSYAPFLIIQKIVEDGDKTRKHVTDKVRELTEQMSDLRDKFSAIAKGGQTAVNQMPEEQRYEISPNIPKVRGVDADTIPSENPII